MLTSSLSPTISSISVSPILSPIVIMACLKSRTVILPSWSESKTLSASIKSLRVSLSFPRSWTVFSRIGSSKYPYFLSGSTFCSMSLISVSVGLRFNALTRVPSSVVATYPLPLLSKRAKISLISFDDRLPAIEKICIRISWLQKWMFSLTCHFFSYL